MTVEQREPLRFLVFSASLRSGSLQHPPGRARRRGDRGNGATVDVASMRDFDAAGRIAGERLRGRFEDTIVNFLDLVRGVDALPCVKRAWAEFLGERPDPQPTASTPERGTPAGPRD